ncbi:MULTISPECIES: 2-hydroxyacid dehydrogenase [unclassified Brenneria]|uniref:2-hydroxyacid dehydrogenase n=1 Tax=unclassified Brenneria TaxID=2634434 RepID=UPI0015529B22|nr:MULTISPECIES: 2-hydroxyacid dehydrogenase [unclassified Brenneria]MBJ7220461.1 2-hydroxyacid dehydrogenase [Brenneria sp. L3-3C-1]MEE3641705.1 2-hydroxyacid dehydrogenase [Brenneria sp. L3_3C_1]MEE3649665.1 2-hydroxyacid dehydrogenase [Brenneria sp. HEZEL_4_2_4]NPC99623.1 2-hydroxyacid dehydrogenase [Brenneria sp. hezel4-2-4]
MLKITFLDKGALPETIFLKKNSFRRPQCRHQWVEYSYTSPEQVIARAKNSDIIITNKTLLTRETLSALPDLKLIAVTATGTNNIDTVAAAELGIAVKNVPDYSTQAVSEHTIAMIFALKHSLMGWYRDQLSDRWASQTQFSYFDHPVKDIAGSTLGIFGAGAIGREVARLATALGMKVIFSERNGRAPCRPGYLPFEQVLQSADIISLHCPLSEETRCLINSQTLALCKPTAFIINTARGGLIDEAALISVLNRRGIAGAALDGLTQEPPAKDNPLMLAAKILPNLLITPHISWTSASSLQALMEKTIENIDEFVQQQGD